MKASSRRISVLIAVLVLSAIALKGSLAQSETQRYFPQTGHYVIGELLAFYESIPNPTLIYGYPITDAFTRVDVPGEAEVTYQYFERARFEFRPDQPADLQVKLSPLGIYLYDQAPPAEVVSVSPGLQACRDFSETGYAVCYTFLEFFDQHGGIAQFGYPISPVEIREGWLVQYFQRARFEWHPELPPGERVVLTNVGQDYFDLVEDPKLLQPLGDRRLQVVLDLKVEAFVKKAVLSPGEQQTLYVIVRDQNLLPVAGAQVIFTQTTPAGEDKTVVGLTNGEGIVETTFSVANQAYGIREIQVTVNYENFQEETVTSYRVWW